MTTTKRDLKCHLCGKRFDWGTLADYDSCAEYDAARKTALESDVWKYAVGMRTAGDSYLRGICAGCAAEHAGSAMPVFALTEDGEDCSSDDPCQSSDSEAGETAERRRIEARRRRFASACKGCGVECGGCGDESCEGVTLRVEAIEDDVSDDGEVSWYGRCGRCSARREVCPVDPICRYVDIYGTLRLRKGGTPRLRGEGDAEAKGK